MQTEHIVALLIAERDRLNRAIEALGGSTRRRGRQPASQSAPAGAGKSRKRRRFTAAQRKEQSERMRAFWAARRKQKK